MTSFEEQVVRDLGLLKGQMSALLGNGQPGRLRLLEERVEQHESAAQKIAGVGGAIGVGLAMLHFAIDYLRLKH